MSKKQKLITFIIFWMLFNGVYFLLNSFVNVFVCPDKWLSRLCISLVCFGFGALLLQKNEDKKE